MSSFLRVMSLAATRSRHLYFAIHTVFDAATDRHLLERWGIERSGGPRMTRISECQELSVKA